ncbi:MAG: flagellar assembly protein FliW [Myxococcales bacterium]|nr:flagellar assembly protein FliW [Myxococcales bacterium]
MDRLPADIEMDTERFGKIRVPDSNVLYFENGVLAFEHCKRWALIRLPDQEPFQWMQSLDDGALAFVLMDPCLVAGNFRAELKPSQVGALWHESSERMIVLAIATIPANPKDTTVNLAGPIVIDVEARRGAQIVLNTDRWETRHPVFTAAPEGDNGDDGNGDGLDKAA